MEKRKKIAYVDGSNPTDKCSWSGTTYNLVDQLKRFYDVDVIYIQDNIIERTYKFIYKCLFRTFKIKNDPDSTAIYAKMKGFKVTKILKRNKYEAVFFRGSNLAAYMNTDIPVKVYFSDACFHQMVNYYFFNLSKSFIKAANKVQKLALQNCTANIFASNWALCDAVDFYGISESKCYLGYLGASVDTKDFKKKDHDISTVNLLFVGVEWERKGGKIAVECTKYLNEIDNGHKYTLHFVGCKPPYEINDENVILYGFLNRNIPEQAQKMINLREIADFFILPTRAECAGIVFCESSAYGIPSITYDTGGIGDYVINGENGYRLPLSAEGKDFGDKIIEIMKDSNRLQYMKMTAEKMYKERLNWNALGDTFHKIIK